MKKSISFFILLFFSTYLFSGNICFRQFTIDDGIPQSSINQIVQDSTGFIWFSTNQGLYRFDGSIFKKYPKIGKHKLSVVNNITPLANQNYVISDMWNIYFVTLKDTIFLLKKIKLNHQIKSITTYNKSHYFLTKDTIYKINKNLNISQIKFAKNLNAISNFQNQLYICAEDGFYRLNKSKLVKISDITNILSIFNDKNKVLYLGNNSSKIYTFRQGKISKSQIILPKKNLCINTINKDKKNNLWIGTTKGVFKFTNKIFKYYSAKNGLGANIVSKIFVDNENNIWIGLSGNGISKYITEKFLNLKSDDGLNFDNITSISQGKKGLIYLANSMENSLNIINQKNHQISKINANFKSKIVFNRIYADQNKDIWLLNFNAKIYRLKGKTIIPFYEKFFKDNYRLVTDIVQDYSGNYWITTGKALLKYEGKSFKEIKLPKNIAKYSLYKLFVDKENRLWIATTKNGLILKDGEIIRNYTVRNGLPSNYIIDITEDSHQNIWIATNKGFSKFQDNNFYNFSTKDGLSSNLCKFIKILGEKIFIGTDNGLNIYNGNFIKTYYKSDGIVSSEINRNAGFIDNYGNLWFGTKGGVTKYNPNEDRENTVAPKIYFINIYNLNHKIPITDKIILNSNQNNLSIHYSAISFTNPENLVYEYKLIPGSEDWIKTKNRKVDFNNLSPNKYIFQLRARNDDDIWSHKPQSITFIIKKPLYIQPKFILLYLIAFIFLLIYIFHRKNQLQRAEIRKKQIELTKERSLSLKLKIANEKLTQLSKMKDDFLSKVSHELRTPLNAIIGLTDFLIDSNKNSPNLINDLTIISQSARRLNTLVSGILDFTKLQNKEIIPNPVAVDIYQQIEMILSMYRTIKTNKNIEIINEVSPDIALINIDETHFYHIITNLLSNAIKFTHSGFVKISALVKDNFVQIDIQDTGIGIPENKLEQIFYLFEQIQTDKTSKGTGLGLSITKKFVELNKGQIWVTSKINEGSTFHLLLPKSARKRTSNSIANLTQISKFPENQEIKVDFKTIQNPKKQSIIFAIDDEISNLQVLEHYFSDSNLIFRYTDSAEDGLEWLLNKKIVPDLILLDIMMPRVSGLEILSKIREIYSITSLPIILLTAKNQISDFVNGLELGANDYIAKPYTKIELLQRVKMHLNISKINKSIMRFVPQEFLNYINKSSLCDIKLGDNKKSKMTIMFSDIRSFTELSETMTPRESFDFLNSFLKEIGPIIRRHHGFIDNFIGDATLSVFPRNVDDAMLCGINMQKKLVRFNKKRETKGYVPIAIGIGIHWAEFIIGTIGEEYRMAETVISAGVNLASRLENLTKFYKTKILVSEITIEQMDKSLNIHYRFLGNINLKGISKAVKIYEILDCYFGEDLQKRIITTPDFEKAVAAFEREEFDLAADYFNKISENNKSDLTAKTYFEQCLYYQNKNFFK